MFEKCVLLCRYAYPPPDGNILTNIVNTLIAVPRFYTQVTIVLYICFYVMYLVRSGYEMSLHKGIQTDRCQEVIADECADIGGEYTAIRCCIS